MSANTNRKPFFFPFLLLLLVPTMLLLWGCSSEKQAEACSISLLYDNDSTAEYIAPPSIKLDLGSIDDNTTRISGVLTSESAYTSKYKIFFWENGDPQTTNILLKGDGKQSPINFTIPVSPGFESLHLQWYSYYGAGLKKSSRSDIATTSVYRKSLNSNYFLDALKNPNNISDIFISYSQTPEVQADNDHRGALGIVGEAIGNGLTFLPLNIELTRDGYPLVYTDFNNQDSTSTCPNMNISRLTLNAVEKCTANYEYPPTQLVDYIGALMGRAVMVLAYNPKRVKIDKVYDVLEQAKSTNNVVYMPKGYNLNRTEIDGEHNKLINAGAQNPLFIYSYSITTENNYNRNEYTLKQLYNNNDDKEIPDYVRGIKLRMSTPPETLDDFFMVDMASKFVPTESGHKLYSFLKELKKYNLLVIRDLQVFGDYTSQVAQGTSTKYGILRPAIINEYNLGVHAFLTTQPEHLLPVRKFILTQNISTGYIKPPKYNVLNVSLEQAKGTVGSGKIKITYDNPPLFNDGDSIVVELLTLGGLQTYQQQLIPNSTSGEITMDNLKNNHEYHVKIYTQGNNSTSIPINLFASPNIPQIQGITHNVKDNNTIVLNINLNNIDNSNISKIIVRPINNPNPFSQNAKNMNISKRYTDLQPQLSDKQVFCYNITTTKIPVKIPQGHAKTMEIYLLSNNNIPSAPTTYRAANILPTIIHEADAQGEINFNFSITSDELIGAELPLFNASTIGVDNIDIYQEGELGFDDMQEGADGNLHEEGVATP